MTSTRSHTRLAAALAILTLGVPLLSSCGGDDDVSFGATGAWTRPTPTGATSGVIYLTVTSDIEDAIVSAEVPDDVAGAATLHATEVSDDGGHHHHGSDDEGGAPSASMVELAEVPIDAGGTVVFEPGGNHVMLEGLPDPLEAGEAYTLRLDFASGRTLDVEVVVADNPPG